MTDDPNGWPDAARPGVPLHPEGDGWHWVRPKSGNWTARPALWLARDSRWTGDSLVGEVRVGWFADVWTYEGPCLTPAEVAAREAAAAEAMREACAAWIEENIDVALDDEPLAEIVRRLRLPAPGALDRARKEAWRAGMEEAACMHEELATDLEKIAHQNWRDGLCGLSEDDRKAAQRHRDSAAAIRARMGDDNAEG